MCLLLLDSEFYSNFQQFIRSSVFIISVVVVFASFVCYRFLWKKKYHLPPGPRGLPIFGYLPFLGREPFKDFHRLSQDYGSIFGLYLGRNYVVILGNWIFGKEGLSKSSIMDKSPRLFDFMPDGIGFSSSNGQEWIEQRRYCLKAMRDLGLGKSRWEAQVQEEVDSFVKFVAEQEGQPTDINEQLTSSVSNNITSLVFGRSLTADDPNRRFLDDSVDVIMKFFSQTNIRNYFPRLVDLLVKLGVSSFARTYEKMVAFNQFVKREIDLRKKDLNKDPDVFIDGYLMEIERNHKQSLKNSFNDSSLCGNVQGLFLGGSDTTRTAINWMITAMAKYPDVQAKVHKELDTVLGRDGKILWTERTRIPYTLATILEGQRWRPITPLNTSRIASEDVQIGGYDIPKGTTVIVNTWALHRDAKYWKNPEEFDPEHFLTEDGKEVILKAESYIPFSYGRRNCPGETIAMMEILLYFVGLMQKFLVQPPSGEKVRLDGIVGLTYRPAPQKLCFIPRG